MSRLLFTAITVLTLVAAVPALAQKSKDTVRIPINEPISGLSDYLNANPESEFNSEAVHDTLIRFDEEQNKYVPLLAKSWRRVDDRTLEVDLRDDVTWHDGEKFDSEDVKHTFEWAANPEAKVRSPFYYDWIQKVETLGPYKLRVVSHRPTPYDEAQLAVNLFVMPEHLYSRLPIGDKLAFTRKPVGTGMYRAVEVNDAKGIFLAKNDAYKHGGTTKPAGNIRYLNQPYVPDVGAQVAEFLAGNLDILRQVNTDQLKELAKMPNVKAVLVQGPNIAYMYIDARGRAGVKALTDPRVRQAIFMAVDRDQIMKLVVGDFKLNRVPDGMCWKDQMACDFSLQPPVHDPAGAKKLLAEAGYPNGFDVEIVTFASSIADYAVAISGQLSKIGIRSTVQKFAVATQRKVEAEGKIAIFVGAYPSGSLPDAASTISYFYDRPPSGDFHGDTELHEMARRMDGVMDQGQRKEMARQIFDRATEQAYIGIVGPRVNGLTYRDHLDVKVSRYSNVGFWPWDVNAR